MAKDSCGTVSTHTHTSTQFYIILYYEKKEKIIGIENMCYRSQYCTSTQSVTKLTIRKTTILFVFIHAKM